MPKKKILHVITKLELGGAQQNTLHTSRKCDKNEFISLVACGPGGMLERGGANDIVRVRHLGREINPVKDFLAFLELLALFRREKPDVVHTHSSKAGVIGRLAAFFARVPLVVHTYHGFGFHDWQKFLTRNFFVLLEKICAGASDVLVFVSKANMNLAKDLSIGSPEKYRLVRSGINLSAYRAETDLAQKRKKMRLPEKGKVVISVGNLKPQKNHEDFLRIAERIIPVVENSYFVYVGGGAGLGEIRRLLKIKKLDEKCMFLGWRKDIPELLAVSDIFVLTSLWEGLPRSLVEAFKSGLPAVCYDAGGVADILENGVNGFLVERNNRDMMYNSLKALLENDDLRSRMSRAARNTDLADFDIDLMVKRLEKIYGSEA